MLECTAFLIDSIPSFSLLPRRPKELSHWILFRSYSAHYLSSLNVAFQNYSNSLLPSSFAHQCQWMRALGYRHGSRVIPLLWTYLFELCFTWHQKILGTNMEFDGRSVGDIGGFRSSINRMTSTRWRVPGNMYIVVLLLCFTHYSFETVRHFYRTSLHIIWMFWWLIWLNVMMKLKLKVYPVIWLSLCCGQTFGLTYDVTNLFF